MKLLIKSKWRGVFQMYLIDFKQKEGRVKKYPTPKANLRQSGFKRFKALYFFA